MPAESAARALLCVAAALALGGCGGEDGSSSPAPVEQGSHGNLREG